MSPETHLSLYIVAIFMAITVILVIYFIRKLKQKEALINEYKILTTQLEFKANQYSETAIKLDETQTDLQKKNQEITRLQTVLEEERRSTREKLALVDSAEKKLVDTFKALSAEALSTNNKSFLDLAKTSMETFHQTAKIDLTNREKNIANMMTPIKEALTGVDVKLKDLENARVGAYEVLKHQVTELISTQKELKNETNKLVGALRAPTVRGRWGEMQLRRVVELTGMSSHCDFLEQASLEGDTNKFRPDMIVNLPGEKHIIIDAKTPLSSYLDAIEEADETIKTAKLKDHARQVRLHINALSSKAYWDQLPKNTSPEFVVLFLPGETFFTAALEQDPSLIELGVEKKVILTTPSTLIAMLHAVAYGWRQENLAKNAQQISDLGKELYKRLSDMGGHFTKLGKDLNLAVHSYNSTLGSLEMRVLPSARKFHELNGNLDKTQIEHLKQVDSIARTTQSTELKSIA